MNPRKAIKFLLVALILMSFVGCSGVESQANNNANEVVIKEITQVVANNNGTTNLPTLPEKYIFATSEPGYATVHGVLNVMDPIMMLPDPDDGIFLVPLDMSGGNVVTIPPFTKGDVPQAEVDETTGEFVFTNIDPGRYAVVVLTKSGSQVPAKYLEKGSLVIFTVTKADIGAIVELGQLRLP